MTVLSVETRKSVGLGSNKQIWYIFQMMKSTAASTGSTREVRQVKKFSPIFLRDRVTSKSLFLADRRAECDRMRESG